LAEAQRRVIIITDGDYVAQKVVEQVARKVGGRCITLSAGNPTPLSGKQMVALIKKAPHDPVLIMCDDNGNDGRGRGEQTIEYVLQHPDIDVIGAVAVASNTRCVHGARVHYSINQTGHIVEEAVDKDGHSDKQLQHRIYGDTVDILNRYHIPNVIGIGDIGKMEGRDRLRDGCPVTLKAVQWILQRSERHDSREAEAEAEGSAHCFPT
jgi:stage V sporulation protein AE